MLYPHGLVPAPPASAAAGRLRVLIVSYAMHGHARCCLDLSGPLADAGHDVHFAIPLEGRTWITHPQVKYEPFDPPGVVDESLTAFQRNARAQASQTGCWASGMNIVLDSMARTYGDVFKTIDLLLRNLQPDVVVTPQMTTPVIDAAAALHIPVVIRAVYVNSLRRGTSPLLDLPGPHRLGSRLRRIACLAQLWQTARRMHRVRRRFCDGPSGAELLRHHTVLGITAACIEEPGEPAPNVILTGPLRREPDTLHGDTAQWLDARVHEGVVLVAMGSLVRLHPPQIRAIAEALSQCGHPALWALPAAQQSFLPDLPSHIRVESFVQQTGVLAHPATRCFVTHSGGNSSIESMFWARPMLNIPFMLDQPHFARRAAALGVGLTLSPCHLSAEAVLTALTRLCREGHFTHSAQALSVALRNTLGMDGAIAVIEQAARAGSLHGVK